MSEENKNPNIMIDENQDVSDMLNAYDKQAEISTENDEDEEGGKLRTFKNKYVKLFFTAYAVLAVLYHVYSIVIKLSVPMQLYAIHWGTGLFLAFMLYPAKKGNVNPKKGWKVPLYDIICAILVVAVVLHVAIDAKGFEYRVSGGTFTQLDLIMGGIAVLLTLEAARRTIGMGLPVIAIIFTAYCLWGNYLPPLIASKGYSLKRTLTFLFGTEGIFGAPTRMSSKYVFLLVIFGAFLGVSGTGEYFIRLATKVAGGFRGGPAKVAVVASGLFGSISGSAVANVMGTGVFTIPLMRKTGYKPHFAGAVEAVASTGGQILPPVMGSGAFIMAELMGISYSKVVVAALVPALLYYFAVFVMVDLEAGKEGLVGVDTSKLDSVKHMLRDGWNLLLPLFVLIYVIAFSSGTVSRAAVYAIVATILGCAIKKSTRLSMKQIISAMETGVTRSITTIAAVACAGITVGAIMLSGIGTKFTYVLTQLAGGKLFLTLLFSGIAATILGMGLPTVAAYVIAASLLVSSLTTLGVPQIAAHLFLFYYALLSQITPPVALAAYAAANICNSNPNKVGFTAMRLGIVAFIIPFFFVYGNELLIMGETGAIIIAIISSFVGVYCLSVAFAGWFAGEKTNIPCRVILLVAAFCTILPGTMTDLIGLGLIVVFVLLHSGTRHKIFKKKSAASV